MSDDEKVKAENINSQGDKVVENIEKKKVATWKKVVLGLIVFVVGIAGFAFFSTRGVVEAGREFISDLQAGNCSEIYSRTTDGFKEDGTEDQWNEACARISAILQGEPSEAGVEISSASGRDQISEVRYKIVGTDDITYGIALEMVNRDGLWQLNAFDSDPLEDD